MIPTYIEYEILAAGLTQAIDITELVDEYRLFTAAPLTLAGDVTITPAGTPIEGCRTVFKYEGKVTLNGHDMTIYGRTITQAEALSACKIECNYNNSVWDVVLYYSDRIQQANIVTYNTWDGSGSTINLNPITDSKNQVYTATAPISLTGSYVVQVDPTYTPVEGDEFIVKYECLATLNANTITIFGQNIPAVQALGGNVEVRTVYDSATSQWMTSHRVLFDNNMYRVLGSSGDTSPAYLDSKVGKSVVVASNKIELDGDALTPGNNYYYGTNGSGTKGFHDVGTLTLWEVGSGTTSCQRIDGASAANGDVSLAANGGRAEGDVSVAIGPSAVAHYDGAFCLSGGLIAVDGDAQTQNVPMRAYVSSGTTGYMVDASDVVGLIIPENCTANVTIKITGAFALGSGSSFAQTIKCAVTCNTGTVAVLPTTATTVAGVHTVASNVVYELPFISGTINATVAIDLHTNYLRIKIIGDSVADTKWYANVQLDWIGYNAFSI